MVTVRFWTRWMVLLISLFLLASCGSSKSSTTNAASLKSERTAADPFPLDATTFVNTATPHHGHVGNKNEGKSYYQVTGLAAGTYTITLYGLGDDADLLIYNDLPFDFADGPVCAPRKSGKAEEQCIIIITAANSTMNIEVDGQYSVAGTMYFISINTPTGAAACTPGAGCFDFDNSPTSSTFPAPFVRAQTGGAAPWDLDNSNAFGTGDSIHSGPLTAPGTSCFSHTVTTPADSYVTFDLTMVNSTPYYDLLLFYIDNVLEMPAWFGTVSAQKVRFNTVAGTHTYKWCHSNSNTNTGDPTTSGDVWVDNIYIK